MYLKRVMWFAAIVTLCAALILAVSMRMASNPSGEPVDFGGIAFSSMEWHVRLAQQPAGMSRETVQRELQARLDEVERVLSNWREDSEISALNRTRPGDVFTASPLLYRSLETALAISDWSGGAYDVTVAPLVNLWGFGPKGSREQVPTDAEIRAAQSLVGWRSINTNQHLMAADKPVLSSDRRKLERSVVKNKAVQVDLSSIGEGVGVNALKEWLEARGIHDYLVSVAGTLATSGKKTDGSKWEVAIEKPDSSGSAQKILTLTNMAVSTSGSYRNYFEKDGIRYSHTINPATGRPIDHHGVSVTVLLPSGDSSSLDAGKADAMATALNVLGPDAGWALAERDHVAALYVVSTPSGFVEKPTSGFKKLQH